MFKRITDDLKKAIFIAYQSALCDGSEGVDSSHLLLGLLVLPDCRANTILRLREVLPGQQNSIEISKWKANRGKRIPFTKEGGRILAHTFYEANQLRDYWIDTEHCVLGILRDGNNGACSTLAQAGLELRGCRQRVLENKSSRPLRKDPVLWWPSAPATRLGIALQIAFIVGIVLAMFLLRNPWPN